MSKCELYLKEYLSQARNLKHAIDDKHKQIAQLQYMAARATGTYEAVRVGGTKSRSKLEEAVIDIASVGDELAALMSDFAAKYRDISRVIGEVENPKYNRLLTLRYLRFMTWEEIAAEMGYSYVHVVHRLHPRALNEVKM